MPSRVRVLFSQRRNPIVAFSVEYSFESIMELLFLLYNSSERSFVEIAQQIIIQLDQCSNRTQVFLKPEDIQVDQ